LRSKFLIVAATLALALSSCGDGDDGSSVPAEDPETVSAVSAKIERAALRIANSTPDKHLPGPYDAKLVCLTPEQAANSGTPATAVQCHVETFTRPKKGRPEAAYVWSEDWRVPVEDGRLGEPEIVGEYRIRNYLRRDNRLNCSGGKTPHERCTGEFTAPPEESGIGGGGSPPPTGGQQEVPINP
jgi:hypothetical protein